MTARSDGIQIIFAFHSDGANALLVISVAFSSASQVLSEGALHFHNCSPSEHILAFPRDKHHA